MEALAAVSSLLLARRSCRSGLMEALAAAAGKVSAAFGLLTAAGVPILRFGSLDQASWH